MVLAARGCSSLVIFEDLFNPRLGERQMVFVLFEPLPIILLDGISPVGVDLSGGVLPFLQPLMSKQIAQVSGLGCFHHLLRQLWRDEDHPAIPSKNHVAW